MAFKYTTAISKIRAMKARKKVIQGGASAGKTFGIIPVLIDKATQTIPQLRRGALKDFVKIMKLTGRWVESRYNKSLLTYNFANGSYIEFFSADQEDRIRGPRRHILYINEANRLTFDTYHQLSTRTENDIYLCFNPTAEFWAHTEVLNEANSELLVLTYRDNEALPQNVLEDFETARIKAAKGSNYWTNYVKVFIEGQVGNLQGVVFEDWETIETIPTAARLEGYGVEVVFEDWETIETIPTAARLEGYGVDFGFSDSAFAMVGVYKLDGAYYLKEIVYSTGLTNIQAAEAIKRTDFDIDAIIYADSAEPKSIYAMQLEGLNIMPCASKTDIRSYAIDKLQSQTFYVDQESTNLIDNLRRYIWATDKNGKSTGKPKKEHDHAIDAVIYFIGTDDKYSGEY
jgi:phage terminase large subunit